MKSLTLAVLLAACSIAALGQSPVIRWAPGLPGADRLLSQGRVVKTIQLDGVSLLVALAEDRLGSERVYYDKFVVRLVVANDSERRFDVLPDDVSVEVTKPKNRALKRETAEHLAGSIKWRSSMAGALGQIGANAQTTQTQSTGQGTGTITTNTGASATYSGTATATTTSPDHQARQRAAAQADALNDSARLAGADLIGRELAANTVMPGAIHSGLLIFERDKKCEEAVVHVRLDGKVFEFPFTWKRK